MGKILKFPHFPNFPSKIINLEIENSKQEQVHTENKDHTPFVGYNGEVIKILKH